MQQIPENRVNVRSYEIKALFKGQPLAYCVGFYVFAFYLELHFRIPELQAIRFQFTYGAFIGCWCILNIFGSKKNSELNSVTKSALLLIFILGIYTIFSMDREESIRVYNDRVIKFSLVAFFIYAAVERVADLRVILAFMILAWLKIAQEGFWGWLSGGLVWENQGIPRLHGSTNMFRHPNSYSGFAVGCLPFAIFLLSCVKSNLLRIGLIVLLIFSFIIIITTGSRTGYVAVLLGAIFLFFKLKSRKVAILCIAVASLLIAANFIPNDYKERFQSIFTGQEKEGQSSKKRKEIISDAFQVYAAHPFGVGVQAFPKAREEMFGRTQNTHNLYLELLTNIGPWGLLVFLFFIFRLIQLNNRNIKALRHTNFNYLDQSLLVNTARAIIGFILLRLLLGFFGMDLYEIYWWLALGFSLAITKLINVQSTNA